MKVNEILGKVSLTLTPYQAQPCTNLVWELTELVLRVEVLGETDDIGESGAAKMAFKLVVTRRKIG